MRSSFQAYGGAARLLPRLPPEVQETQILTSFLYAPAMVRAFPCLLARSTGCTRLLPLRSHDQPPSHQPDGEKKEKHGCCRYPGEAEEVRRREGWERDRPVDADDVRERKRGECEVLDWLREQVEGEERPREEEHRSDEEE